MSRIAGLCVFVLFMFACSSPIELSDDPVSQARKAPPEAFDAQVDPTPDAGVPDASEADAGPLCEKPEGPGSDRCVVDRKCKSGCGDGNGLVVICGISRIDEVDTNRPPVDGCKFLRTNEDGKAGEWCCPATCVRTAPGDDYHCKGQGQAYSCPGTDAGSSIPTPTKNCRTATPLQTEEPSVIVCCE